MGSKVFNIVQWGKETTAGTAVPADTILLGEAKPPMDRIITFPEDNTGTRLKNYRTAVYQKLVDGMSISVPHGYFQALPMIFSIGLKGGVTAVEQTTDQDDYLWTFTPSLTGANSPDTITLEVGDDTQAYEIEHVMARSITISGQTGQDAPVTIEASVFGKQLSPVSQTTGLSLPTAEPMIANLVEIYIDSAWADLGTTQKTALLREFTVEFLTGLHPKFHGDSLMFTTYGEGYIDVMANFVLEGGSDADSLFDDMQAETSKAIRINIIGAQIGTGDTHSLQIDMFGRFEQVLPMDQEVDADNLHSAVFRVMYDTVGGSGLAVAVTTDVAAI